MRRLWFALASCLALAGLLVLGEDPAVGSRAPLGLDAAAEGDAHPASELGRSLDEPDSEGPATGARLDAVDPALAGVPPRPYAGELRTLEGVVLDGRLRTGLPGARILVLPEELGLAGTTAGAAGAFRIEVPAGGTYTLAAAAEGFATGHYPEPGLLEQPLQLVLEPTATLRVVFLGPGSAQPVQGAALALWEGRSERASGEPDRLEPLGDGPLEPLELVLEPGVWSLALLSEDAPFVVVPELRLDPGGEALAEVLLPERAAWRGRAVLKRTREPVEGVEVTVIPSHDSVRRSLEALAARRGVTGPDGRVVVAGLARGAYRVEVATPWGQPYQLEATLEPGAEDEQLIIVAPPARLGGVVLDAEGAGVPGLEVAVVSADHFEGAGLDAREERDGWPGLVQRATTDGGGRFDLGTVAANRPLAVLVRLDGAIVATETTQVGEGQRRDDLELRVAAERALRVTVTDPEGLPLEGALVRLGGRLPRTGRGQRTRLEGEAARTGPDGTAALRSLERVHQWVWAELHGFDSNFARLETEEDAVVLVLEPEPRIEGLVLDPFGAAVPGVYVHAERPGADDRRRGPRGGASTDANGRFSFAHPGSRGGELEPLTVAVRERGWRSVEEAEVAPGAGPVILRAARELPPEPGTLRGQVVLLGSGAPVPGLEVLGAQGGVLHTDGSFFEVREVVPGNLQLALRGDGVELVRLEPVDLPSNGALDLGRFELRRTTTLIVRVEGVPEGVRASARLLLVPPEEGGSTWGQGVRLDRSREERGAFQGEVPRCAWRLVVEAPGCKRHQERLVPTGRRQERVVRLEPQGS
ncbi:MAG: carboxypeptidase regulatory-like domain-containing protein [Planctomycetes bacterium]|nr:carboxypeptidase regulatory-like domain-containing protein [Planctomycetota bacterium]